MNEHWHWITLDKKNPGLLQNKNQELFLEWPEPFARTCALLPLHSLFSSAVYHYHWPLAEDVASAVAICFCCCLKLSLLYRVQALCAQESCGFFFRTSCHGMSSDTFNHAFCRCLCFLFPFTSAEIHQISLFPSIPQSLIWEFCMSQLVIHNTYIYIYTISDEDCKNEMGIADQHHHDCHASHFWGIKVSMLPTWWSWWSFCFTRSLDNFCTSALEESRIMACQWTRKANAIILVFMSFLRSKTTRS